MVRWILVDLALALAALVVLGVLALGLWRRIKSLSRTVSRAGEAVATATDALALVQADGPLGRSGRPDADGRPDVVGRSRPTGL